MQNDINRPNRCLLWFILDSDLPEEHPRVSQEVTKVLERRNLIFFAFVVISLEVKLMIEFFKEKELILSSRSFDPVKSEKLLSGNVFLLLRDMLRNK